MIENPDKNPLTPQEQYKKNAEQVIDEATLPVIKELGREAVIEAEQIVQSEGVLREATEPLVDAMAKQVVAEAEFVQEHEDIREKLKDSINAFEGGVPRMAAYGYASGGDIASYGNERLQHGDNPVEVNDAVQQAQLWEVTPLRVSRGLASSQELVNYGNNLLKVGVRPEAAKRLVKSALHPRKIQVPPEILAMYPPEARAKYLPDLPPESEIKPTYGTG